MPLDVRSPDELGARARGFFRQYLTGADAWIKQNFVAVTARVLAQFGRAYELRLKYLFDQLFVRTCTEISILRLHGADVRVYLKGAAAATGSIAGIGQPGATYPAGVRYLSGGTTYLTTAAFTASGDGSFAAAVKAETTGAATNRDGGAALALADAALYPTLSDTVDVSSDGLGGGADIEGIEDFRARILARKGQPPQGGSLADYERFALEVPGVVKAWAFAFSGGVGSIVVFFLFRGRPNLIPTEADVAVVQAYIDAKRLIRVDDDVASAPTPDPVDITIDNLTVDTPEIRAAIETALDAMFLARCRPGVVAKPFTLSRSWIGETISAVAGEDSHTLAAPAGDLTFTASYPVRGTVTYA
ncbi:putative phage protein gp47/JayE [Angulomicrobium tetraedrale]|uniref:Putative phage protein gp47/JayE n=1 Tax=Ancylobacter tetraedralis TaxID=217068 RepID=A0A839Z9U8_9HYPH|nr:baseplate J/gp47 family protein [Ancylobacter tetraedralis]MBB3771511.1 putative phage protein gp47/JayE [Ancylobacter tetraedralis]